MDTTARVDDGAAGRARRAVVIVVSDRSSQGVRPDASGPRAVERLRAAGYTTNDATIVPDGAESVSLALREALGTGARLVVTSGGTGVGPRDETPEGTREHLRRELPGIPEAIRRAAADRVPASILSRGLAGVTAGDAEHGIRPALVVNLPGSPKGVDEGLDIVLSVADHVLDQLDGGDHA